MEAILKSIGWNELYPETMKRITFFKNGFRKHYSIEEISDEDLNMCVAYNFAIYGQGFVYDIYCKVNHALTNTETLQQGTLEQFANKFESFIQAFEKAIPNATKLLKPTNYINLFIEYAFSCFLKNQKFD